jgi:anti-sigma-K factor RskA
MSDVPSLSPDERDQLAAEYALGVLDAPGRRRVEALAARDAAFATALNAWEMRLAPLVDEVAPVTPPPAVWTRIDKLVSPAPASQTRPAAGIAFWRWLSFGSMGLAAASIAAAIVITRPPAPAPMQLAALSAPDGKSLFTVVIDKASGQATLVPQADWANPGRVPELWLVPPSGAPVSMGVFDPAQPARVTVPGKVVDGLSAGVTLAVSVEPPGGSPTGQPTGAVVAVGKLLSI